MKSSDHRWTIIRGCNDVPIVIGMSIPQKFSYDGYAVHGFESFKQLKSIGFDLIVTCCTTQQLGKLSHICNVLSIQHIHIEWDDTKLSIDDINTYLERVVQNISNGRRVAVCCPCGIGNTAVFGGALANKMMNIGILEQSLISPVDIVTTLRRMGPPGAITSLTQYELLMRLVNVRKDDIYPWYNIHNPHKVADLTRSYLRQYSTYQKKGVEYPIMMNDYSFVLCISKLNHKNLIA